MNHTINIESILMHTTHVPVIVSTGDLPVSAEAPKAAAKLHALLNHDMCERGKRVGLNT